MQPSLSQAVVGLCLVGLGWKAPATAARRRSLVTYIDQGFGERLDKLLCPNLIDNLLVDEEHEEESEEDPESELQAFQGDSGLYPGHSTGQYHRTKPFFTTDHGVWVLLQGCRGSVQYKEEQVVRPSAGV